VLLFYILNNFISTKFHSFEDLLPCTTLWPYIKCHSHFTSSCVRHIIITDYSY